MAHPITFRIAVLVALAGVAGFGGWHVHHADLWAQRQYLVAYAHNQQQLQAGVHTVDAMLAPGKPGALTRYTSPPCLPAPGPSPIHCWTSPQATDTLLASITAALTAGGAQHLTSHCGMASDTCRLSGAVNGTNVRMFLRRVAAPSCQCPAAAGNAAVRTLVMVFVMPGSPLPDTPLDARGTR